jgi:hypothetical protein
LTEAVAGAIGKLFVMPSAEGRQAMAAAIG